MAKASSKPTREQLLAMNGKRVPDLVAPGLRLLFVGINPGLYTAWSGHHFAGPGNRFYKALHLGGFTDRVLHPSEKHELLAAGVGITNVVPRATATAAELTDDEYRKGAAALARKVARLRPRAVAVLGLGAYRVGFAHPAAVVGEQPDPPLPARVWVLPNPSGLNANYSLEDFGRLFADLRRAIDGDAPDT